jgi:hypothetical protein
MKGLLTKAWAGVEKANVPKAHRARKTRMSNPGRESQGILLGRLVSLEVVTPSGIKQHAAKGKHLGYLPGSKTLCVMINPRRSTGPISSKIASLHKKFHNAAPSKASVYEWPDPKGGMRTIGRISALTYAIPPGLRSPEKNKYLWHHEFGDHGERGHGPVRDSGNYPQKYMPLLQIDSAGNLYIKRMPGNKFYVTDWLYW